MLASSAKVFYDWCRQKRLDSRIKKFLASEKLPFSDETPSSYTVGYEPTIRCNLRCKMCYQAQTRAERQDELDTKQILEVFEKLKNKIKSIKLVGGEPFVRQDIFELISFWDAAGKKVILQTNCTLLDERMIDAIKKNKNISDVLTSLDGPREIHDLIRGVPGSFDRLQKAIKLMKENMPHVRISAFATLLVNDNIDKLFELIDTAKTLGLGSVNIIFEEVYSSLDVRKTREILKNILNWNEKDYRLNTQIREPIFPQELNSSDFHKKLSEVVKYGLKKGCFVNFVPPNYHHNTARYLAGGPGRTFCLKLLAPELRINQKGEVIWCDVIEKSFGSLLQNSPDEIWLSDEYQKFRRYLFKNSLPICQRCCKATYLKSQT